MSVTTINALRHPQVLFRGFDADDPRLQRMRELAGASHVMPGDSLDGLRAADWDVLVVEGVELPPAIPESVRVIAFDSPGMGRMPGHQATMQFSGRQPSPTMHVNPDLSPVLHDLLAREAVPWLASQPARPYLQEVARPRPSYGFSFPGRDLGEGATSTCLPLVTDTDGHLLVGAFPRARGGWCWAVPYRSERPERWLAAALESWRADDETRFTRRDPWLARERWSTPKERAARAELAALRTRRDKMMEYLEEQEQALEAAVQAAAEEAEQGARRLLTRAGGDLVEATVAGFTDLGFAVAGVDEGRVVDGVRVVEDFSLTAPEEPQQHVLLDVVGYAGPAELTDLVMVAEHAARHLRREGTMPHRQWLVVNQFLDIEPDERPGLVWAGPEDIASFAHRGGLVIDTRELFRLLDAVASARLSAQDARAVLADQQGVFSAPDN